MRWPAASSSQKKVELFDTLIRSMKLRFVLFRYLGGSVSTAMLDYLAFFLSFRLSNNVLLSIGIARCCAILYNYLFVYKLVFKSKGTYNKSSPRYVVLVFSSGFVTYLLITHIFNPMLANVILAKAMAELTLYFPNFLIQREFVFA